MGVDVGALDAGVDVILLPKSIRIYVATAPTNLRKSFEGLSNEVRAVLGSDPLSGNIYLFINRTRTMVKMLVWTRGGFTILAKRLERGRFAFASRVSPTATRVEIEAHELSMLLEGLEEGAARAAVRWNPPLRTVSDPR